jgi:hypothetical protein
MEDSVTLQANKSGKLWAEDPDQWDKLCTEEGCPICANPMPEEWVLAETDLVWATRQAKATIPGYVCVTCKQHAKEPFDLSPEDQVMGSGA